MNELELQIDLIQDVQEEHAKLLGVNYEKYTETLTEAYTKISDKYIEERKHELAS